MLQPCCYCGIPLQRASQYVGIADVILGLLNFIVMMIHVKELFEGDNSSASSSNNDDQHQSQSSSYGYGRDSHKTSIRGRTFRGLEFIPRELAITILVCYGIQFLMGIALYVSAVNKNRNACLFWLGVTAVTALFTGLFIRLYEMLIVNEFAHELKLEQEVTYFPGQQPIQVQLQHYHHHPNQTMNHHQPIGNPLAPSADTHVSMMTIPTVTPASYNNYHNMPTPEMQFPPPGSGYYQGPYQGPYPPTAAPQQQQYQNVPAALQPPPYYEVAGMGGASNSGQGANTSTGYPVESVLFPNDKNEYRNSFSKF